MALSATNMANECVVFVDSRPITPPMPYLIILDNGQSYSEHCHSPILSLSTREAADAALAKLEAWLASFPPVYLGGMTSDNRPLMRHDIPWDASPAWKPKEWDWTGYESFSVLEVPDALME